MYISYELYQADHIRTAREQREEDIRTGELAADFGRLWHALTPRRASGQRRNRQAARAASSAQCSQARPAVRHQQLTQAGFVPLTVCRRGPSPNRRRAPCIATGRFGLDGDRFMWPASCARYSEAAGSRVVTSRCEAIALGLARVCGIDRVVFSS